MTNPTDSELTPPASAARQKSRTTWAAGDYARIGTRLQPVGEALVETLDLHAGERVLDVAAGNGNAALAAARCDCEVVASDFVPELLALASQRARADGVALRTEVAAAEDLPFAAESFDAVLSTFGVMFAVEPETAARELVRVTRSGGRIGLANWTPHGFVAEMFAAVRRQLPAPAGASSPFLWGDERGVRALLGPRVEVQTAHRFFHFRYRSAAHFLAEFRTWYGPVVKAFEALPAPQQEALAQELLARAEARNRAVDGTLVVASEYLEVVARVR